MRPRIGITTDIGERPVRQIATRYDEIQHYYSAAVWEAGGTPLLLPPLIEAAADMLATIEGLVLSGGDFDLDPALYGEGPRPGLGRLLPLRSSFELELLKHLANKPVLGICGGMQLLNVMRGGALIQDLQNERPNSHPHQQPHDKREAAHAVILSGSLRELFATERMVVNSTHHQAVSRLGSGLVAEAIAEDGVIEAITDRGLPFFVGVQWHPEAMRAAEQKKIYRALVDAC